MSVEFRTDSFASAEARAGFLASSGVGRSRWPDRRDAPNALRLALEERTEPFLYADRNVPGTGGRLQLGGVMMRNDPSELERVLQHAADLIVNAVAAQGPRALENPRSSTIYHEAGHAVLHAHFGEEVRRCKVWQQKRGAQRGQWVGETTVRAGWKSDETTSPLQDFRRACCQIAGLVAELLFDHDNFRRASSVDEIIVANGLAGNAALKMGRDQQSVMVQVVSATFDILKKNDGVVRKLAKDLKRRGVLRAACLTRLLASVCTGPSKYELN